MCLLPHTLMTVYNNLKNVRRFIVHALCSIDYTSTSRAEWDGYSERKTSRI